MMKRILAVVLSAVMVLSLAACSQPAAETTAAVPAATTAAAAATEAAPAATEAPAAEHEPITISMWIDTLVPKTDLLLSEDQWWLNEAIGRFQEKYPYVTVDITLESDIAESNNLFRTASLAGTAPDIMETWSGNWTTDLKDYVLPIYDMLSDEARNRISGWEAVSVGFDETKEKVGCPTPHQGFGCLYYNKEIIAAAGLDFENNPPKTTEEFAAACEAIKAAGYTPILSNEANEKGVFYNVALYWWLQQVGYATFNEETAGTKKYSEDQALIDFLNFYASLYQKGYYNEDTFSSDDAQSRFMVGEGAMFAAYCSRIPALYEAMGDNVGVIKPTDMNLNGVMTNKLIGGAGQALVVSKDTKYPEECIALIEHLTSVEEFVYYFKHDPSKFPNIKGVNVSDLGDIDPVTSKLIGWAGDVTLWPDNCIDGDAITELGRYLPDLMSGKKTAEEVAAVMDAAIANK